MVLLELRIHCKGSSSLGASSDPEIDDFIFVVILPFGAATLGLTCVRHDPSIAEQSGKCLYGMFYIFIFIVIYVINIVFIYLYIL